MSILDTTNLRTRLAVRLSDLYGREVPAYRTLVEVSHEVNARVLATKGAEAERFGSVERVTAERHGAVRVGTPAELSQLARIFGAVGMYPIGFYDLRDAHPQPIPVISTAFRPLDRDELAANPFRVFTSMLVPQDRRFFDADLEARLVAFHEARTLFPDELLELADLAEADGGLSATDAERFLDLATASFALSAKPVDRAWYAELEAISGVAADIGGVTTTHINHLTPRVLDIDDLYHSMTERGIEMIDAIQGPPAWDGPDVLLRQTSFRALAEPRMFRDPDGTLTEGRLRVRFGEVEARGIALTPRGRARYDQLMRSVDEAASLEPDRPRQHIAAEIWSAGMPRTERELERQGLAFFSYHLSDAPPRNSAVPNDLDRLLDAGWIVLEPIVYEDFLPRSAAGIFSSNLSRDTTMDESRGRAHRSAAWLADAIGRRIHVPEEVYAAESLASLRSIEAALGVTVPARRITPATE